jgi:DUF1365 family protein
MGLNSCLYECVIAHRRLRPKAYAFEHRMMMLYVDLDELQAIHHGTRLLSREPISTAFATRTTSRPAPRAD